MKTGFFTAAEMPMSVYLADPCPQPSLSSGVVNDLLTKSPEHVYARHPRLGGAASETSDTMDIGTIAHQLLLGGDTRICEINRANYRSKPTKDNPEGSIPVGWTNGAIRAARDEARANGLTPILAGAMAGARTMAKVARDFIDRSEVAGVFDAGEGELKREADSANGLVRVLTVHGSKGLEAPIVILADATGSPESTRAVALDLADPASLIDPDAEPRRVPLPGLKADERVGRIAEAAEAEARAALREHWRLLYVAMTRAEEALFVTGALAAREEEPGPNSWYTRLAGLFDPADALEDPLWGSRLETGPRAVPPPAPRAEPELPIVGEPGWMRRPAGEEPRPPRPLAPSALGEDLGPEPPAPASAAAAARRGTLIHRLLERLPGCPPDQRADLGARWLARQAAELEPGQRAEILAAALTTIADPRWADLFTTAALAEVPIAATVAGEVIAGTIDRLLVTPSELWLVDFKTTRRPPANAAQVSPAHLRQMAAYAAALEVAYPERAIRVALLYTHAPRLIELDAAQLALHKPGFAAGQQSFDV
jgi:ATP-dependent helicase/nuclease subunit A